MSVTPTLDGKTTAAPSADAHSASPVESPVLRRELLSLEQRLRQFRSSAVTDAREASSRLAELEREFHTLFDRAADPAARPGGAVILAEIHSLAAECRRLGLDDVAEDCALAAQGFLESAARSWRDSRCAIAQAPDPDGCFSSLVETSILELEAELQSAEQSVAAEVFSETRSTLRAAFVDCYENDPPKEDVRERWATELTDRGDLLLTSLDDLPPERAARRLEIVADEIAWHLRHIERRDASAFPPLLRGGSRGGRRRLKRKLSQLRAEQQERRLHSRLENRFGRGLVGASERLVLFLICLVVGLLTVEAFWELSPRTLFWFMAIDTAACAVFLTEFFVKLAHVRGKGGWFRRHFLIDFLPSIPFGLILVALPAGGAADAVRIGRLGRLLRLPLLARYVRVLRPAIRMLRGFGLLARGFDRVVRQYGHILNQNVILYPRRQELQRAQQRRLHDRSDLRRLDGELNECWHALLGAVADADRRTVARSRLEILRDQLGRVPHYESSRTRVHDGHIREIPAAMLIDRLMTTTPQEVEADLGENLLAQLARHVRTFGRWPLRWLPVVRQAVPHITREMSDAELVSAAARRLGALLKRYHDRWFWFADLYGTVTPSQFVDRVGSMLVRSSFRP
ncbi:MAG: hypothetical protein KY476_21060, partial [Planctomycetes bacterium]|nr:hypothetical protein [Planctomycetota bacterium]